MKHRPIFPLLTIALLASGAQADIPPTPRYVGGLWFLAQRYYGPNGPAAGPLRLVNCQQATANCKAATAAKVVGADVVSVNGKAGANPDAALAAKPPAPVVVVFKRRNGDGTTALVTVTFTSD